MKPEFKSQEPESSRPEPRAPRLTPLPVWRPPRPEPLRAPLPRPVRPASPAAPGDVDAALDATIARLTGHRPCRGCGG